MITLIRIYTPATTSVHRETDNNMKNCNIIIIRFYTLKKNHVYDSTYNAYRYNIMMKNIHLLGRPPPILWAGPAQHRTKCRKINAA